MKPKISTVLRGGMIVDGTGAPAFSGDVVIEDGRIASAVLGKYSSLHSDQGQVDVVEQESRVADAFWLGTVDLVEDGAHGAVHGRHHNENPARNQTPQAALATSSRQNSRRSRPLM